MTWPAWRGLIDRAIVDEPPFSVREGRVIRAGYDAEVDRLRDIQDRGRDLVAAVEAGSGSAPASRA